MRKIISKKKETKKKKIKQFITGGVLIFIMLISLIGYSFNSQLENSEEKVIYGEYTFIKENNLWKTDIENLEFFFSYNPEQIEILNNFSKSWNDYYNKPLYIYSENSDAEMEIYRNLFYYNKIVQRVQKACLENEECEGNLPIKTCEDNLIIIKEEDKNEIAQEDNCIFIKGKKEDLVKLTDNFLFKIIGITQ